MDLQRELDKELAKYKYKFCLNHFNEALNKKDIILMKNIIIDHKIILPDNTLKCFSLIANDTDHEIFTFLIKSKLKLDELIQITLNKLSNYKIICIHKLLKICKPFLINEYYQDYIVSLLTNKQLFCYLNGDMDIYEEHEVTNISSNYKNVHHFVDAAICQISYLAYPNILQNILNACKIANFNYRYLWNPSKEHYEIIGWLMKNISRGCCGEHVGWKDGPDSERWPSTNLNDYVKCYSILQDNL